MSQQSVETSVDVMCEKNTDGSMSHNKDLGSEFRWFFSSLGARKSRGSSGHAARKYNYNVLLFLSLFLGVLGADRFYLGKLITGFLKAVTFGGFGIWSAVDFILYLVRQPRDAAGNPVEGFTQKQSFIFEALTLLSGAWGLHYLYIGFSRLFFVRFALWFLWGLVALSLGSLHRVPLGLLLLFFLLILLLAVWWLMDLYLALSGKVTHTADGKELQPLAQRHQGLCLLFSIFGGIFALDRFYLGHRVLGLLKLGTLCGFGAWYLLDVLLALLNSHKDENGNPVLPN